MPLYPRKATLLKLSLLTLTPWAAATAQVVDDAVVNGVRVFAPVYFTEFDPLTALDMVERIPGANTQENEGGRGLSGVRSNLLINGERPPPKGRSARDQLEEMPIDSVIQIELIDAGARLDIDMQGYPQVINVITVENRPVYYEVISQIDKSGTGDVDQRIERNRLVDGTTSFSVGEHDFTISARTEDGSQRSPSGFVAIDPANPEQRVSSLNTSDNLQERIQFNAQLSLPASSTLSVNTEFSTNDRASAPVFIGDDPIQNAINEGSDQLGDVRDFSTEYIRPIASSGELMLAFVDITSTNESESIFESPDLSRASISNNETGETATRVLITNAPTERLTFRNSVSNAFNYFDGGFRIFQDGQEIFIAGSDSRVEEDRLSLDSAVDWNLTDQWSFRGSVGLESYEIHARDVSSGSQADPKGEISVSYRPQPRTTYTLSTTRSVGQLSFNQFLASSELSSEIVTAGASDIKPERQRVVSARYDRRFGDQGVMRFELSQTEVENPVRTVALSDQITISQNTTPKIIDSLELSVDFPFVRFGQEDLILSIGARFSDSDTIDPITGENREVSSGGGGGNFNRGGGGGGGNFNRGGGGGNFGGFTPRHFKRIELRKDPGDGKWSWSVGFRDIQPTNTFSTRQIRASTGERRWDASFSWEPINGLFFRTNVEGPRTQIQESVFYDTVRALGLDPSFTSLRASRQGHQVSFTVEWRRDRFELTGSVTSRPDNITEEALIPFGETASSFLTTGIARTPRAMLRIRVKS